MPRGGPRENAGRPRGNPAEIHRSRWFARVAEVRQYLEGADDLDIVKHAIEQYVGNMVGDNAAAVVHDALESEADATQMRARLAGAELRPITKDEALTVLLHLKMSKNQYSELRLMFNNATSSRFLPHYTTVARHKTVCRPENPLNVTEVLGEVRLQTLLSHTIKRMIQAKETHIRSVCSDTEDIHCTLYATFGMDSATGQKNYKQNFLDPANVNRSDSSLFAATLNPIRLTTSDGTHLWENICPQSPLFCRPVILEYEKETSEYVRRIDEHLNSQIENLEPVEVLTPTNQRLIVKFRLYESQIDGKVFNILTNTSSQSCPCCQAPRSELNNVEHLGTDEFAPRGRGWDFCIQCLHALIKFLRLLVNVSYQLPEHREGEFITDVQESRNNRKRIMQKRFKDELNLRLDQPAPDGRGSTMDGNTSRRAFRDPEKLARILELDPDLVCRFRNILVAINQTEYRLHPEIFQEYAHTTYRLFVSLYGWMRISPSVHKVLAHAGEIQERMEISVGAASESGAELCHKIRKDIRRNFTRKTSRRDQHADLFARCMDLSDPVISQSALKFCEKYRVREELSPEVLALLDTNSPAAGPPRVPRNIQAPGVNNNNDHGPPPENFPPEDGIDIDDFDTVNIIDNGDDTDYDD